MTPTEKRILSFEKVDNYLERMDSLTLIHEILGWMNSDDALHCLDRIAHDYDLEVFE